MFNFNYTFFLFFLLIILPVILFAGQPEVKNLNFYSYHSRYSEHDTLQNLQEKSDKWFAVDKGYHLVGSIISTTGISNSCLRFAKIKKNKSIQISAGFTFTLGLSKEIWDGRHKNNIFSWKDLTADILGIIIGSALLQID